MMRAPFKRPRRLGLALVLLTAGAALAGELPGTLDWEDRVSMGTLVSGVVSEVPVRAGQRVHAGDLLVGLDSRGFRARLAAARAEAARAQSQLEEAQREDERAEELYARTVLSEHERTRATISLREAEAVVVRARAEVMNARLDLERSRLQAPFAGRVLAVHAVPGQAVVTHLQSESLVELAGDAQMLVRAEADLETARAIAAGTASVQVAGRRIAAGRVEVGFEPVGRQQGAPRYVVSVLFSRPADLELRAGQLARLVW
jgi:multidrug efflux system membrane fusion protein